MSTGPKILALAASFKPEAESLNRRLLKLAIKEAKQAGAEITELDYAELDSPIYRDLDDTLPKGAKIFANALLAHDGLLLASPEYNWSIPGAFKNLIDWLSVDARAPLAGKTALLMCASPSVRGGILGLQQLTVPLAHLRMWVYPQLIAIGNAPEQVSDARLQKESDAQHLADCVADFVRATKALHKR